MQGRQREEMQIELVVQSVRCLIESRHEALYFFSFRAVPLLGCRSVISLFTVVLFKIQPIITKKQCRNIVTKLWLVLNEFLM